MSIGRLSLVGTDDAPSEKGRVYVLGFQLQFREADGHLERALRLLPSGFSFREFLESWKAIWENSEYLGVLDPSGPLGRAASIWGHDYPRKKLVFFAAVPLTAGILLLLAIGAMTARFFPEVKVANVFARDHTILLAPNNPPSKKIRQDRAVSGGGGGGDRSPLPASRGRLPRFEAKQFAPPAIVRPDSRIVAEPTLVGPPDIVVPQVLKNWGDPFDKLITMSNGPGSGSGMGAGSGGGIGPGNGSGYGSGSGSGYSAGKFGAVVAGSGVVPPRAIKRTPPQYTSEAYASKIEGAVVLQISVLASGQVRVLRVISGLPMGLTDKAIEAVQQWTFNPGRKDGQAIAMEAEITIYFRL